MTSCESRLAGGVVAQAPGSHGSGGRMRVGHLPLSGLGVPECHDGEGKMGGRPAISSMFSFVPFSFSSHLFVIDRRLANEDI